MKTNYLKYIKIKEETFSIFETYHHQALVYLFKSDVSAKDLSLIKTIHALKKATPNDIMELTNISATNLSNRLTFLTAQGLVERTKNHDDLRKLTINLTNDAIGIINEYQKYVNNFIAYVKKHLTVSEKVTFNHFLNTWSKTKNTNENNISNNGITSNVLDSIENYFLSNEMVFFEDVDVPFTFADLSFLSELYLNEKIVGLSLPKFSEKLFIPYQTVISKIKRYNDEGLIVRDKKNITFSAHAIHAIDQFILLRVLNYYGAMLGASLKEYNVITKVFQLLKEYALTYFPQE